MENLKRPRPIDEGFPRLGHHRQPQRDFVAIAVFVHLQAEARRQTGGEIEQLPNRHLRFARVLAPRSNRICNALIEIEDAVFCGRERGEIPESFRPAVDPLRRLGRSAAGILFEQRPSTLNGEEGSAAMVGRILRRLAHRCRVEMGNQRGRRERRNEKKETEEQPKAEPRRRCRGGRVARRPEGPPAGSKRCSAEEGCVADTAIPILRE